MKTLVRFNTTDVVKCSILLILLNSAVLYAQHININRDSDARISVIPPIYTYINETSKTHCYDLEYTLRELENITQRGGKDLDDFKTMIMEKVENDNFYPLTSVIRILAYEESTYACVEIRERNRKKDNPYITRLV